MTVAHAQGRPPGVLQRHVPRYRSLEEARQVRVRKGRRQIVPPPAEPKWVFLQAPNIRMILQTQKRVRRWSGL